MPIFLPNNPQVTLPLTTKKKGETVVPYSSGLNWGQRPGRNPNQAYLPVPVEVQRLPFFPDRGEYFLIECDDKKIFKCVRAQANGKAIETPADNSLLGVYFRERLGVPLGHLVTINHLLRYGRVSYDIYRIESHKFLLDFSV